ncbi:dynein assembly factor 3, axonemal homolog [Brachypodium distachyon]|uniref:dynein assembly factor 3, axonemal homolog n=1 Tax=Brachypodium distachyon TaxID=15368 RepID=UPI00071D519C|nr:dynein assembly factor 3, axonemal homolog [Brachypodium distachyon]|eukprot:XP_014755987.1 dynein assembly factor 3, axonemal homolog [Brachypodium distachyon]
MEVARATGPTVPVPGVGDVVIDLDPVAGVAGMAKEPEVAPAPSPTTSTAAAAATTAFPEEALGKAPAATEATRAGSPASQQEAAPAGGAATPSPPQPFGAAVGEAVAEEQQNAPPQANDPLSSQTVAASASSSLAATSSTSLGTLAGAEAKKEHAEVLAAAQARIDEKSDLISKYLGEIQGLRVKLEVQTKATVDAITPATRQEVELNSAKGRRARLETELATVQEELVKAGEDNAAKAAQLSAQVSSLRKAKHTLPLARTNHGTLIRQRELETKKLLGIAQSLRDLLPRFELRATRVDGTDVTTLILFFSDLFSGSA